MTEHFWQQEKARQDATPDKQNKILKITYEDAKSLASRKHPKYLYVECLKQSNNWRAYAATSSYTIEDMSMLVCKDIGCAVNYCSLVKMDQPSLWEGSSDCTEEIDSFNKCMIAERRRYAWMDKAIRPPLQEYTWKRIEEKRADAKYSLLDGEEQLKLRKMIAEMQEGIPEEK